jgi:sigma-B regulation protein RsbU (phosphoserine phosphatase)
MRILIADDDPIERRLLESLLTKWGYQVLPSADGAHACKVLIGADSPPIAILDWMMPEMTGIDVCRRVRETGAPIQRYLLLLTSKDRTEDTVAALNAGADDYITKPFEPQELRARVEVGQRFVMLQTKLADRVTELERALAHVTRLQGLLPICTYCKKIRNDGNYWQQVESYLGEHSGARFSHGICPDCHSTHIKPAIEEVRRRRSVLSKAREAPPGS